MKKLIPLLIVAVACDSGTGPPPDPGGASYAVVYDPGRLVNLTAACDRFVTHSVLSLGRRVRGFDLSTNLYDDCSRSGGGYRFWEVLILGNYTIMDTTLTFVPESGATQSFTGTFDANYVRVVLPADPDSLAPTPISLELGPKTPFE